MVQMPDQITDTGYEKTVVGYRSSAIHQIIHTETQVNKLRQQFSQHSVVVRVTQHFRESAGETRTYVAKRDNLTCLMFN